MMQHKRKIIYLAGFLSSLPMGLIYYINSSYLSSFVGEKLVGIIFTLGSISSIIAVIIAPKIFRKIGGYKFLILIAFLDVLSFLGLALLKNAWGIVLMFILTFSFNTLMVFSLDELLKIFSRESKTGEIRGAYLTIGHVALILAQLAAGLILGAFSFRLYYFIGFLVMIIFLAVCSVSLKNMPDPHYDKINSFKYLKSFFQNKNLSLAYSLSFLVQIFYCWMIIYTPIYLYNQIGFSWKEIGIIFTVMLLPFLFIPMNLGRYADRAGERKVLMAGFMVATLFTLLIFFVQVRLVWVWALLLLATRIGASTIESMGDTYFFKHIKSENEEFVGVYRSASPVAYIVGPIVAFVVFSLVPSFNYIYTVLGALMLAGVYLASRINRMDV